MKQSFSSYAHIIWDRVKQAWSLDMRSLSVFRVGLALVPLSDLVLRSRYIIEHYTDMGIYPRWAYQIIGETATTFSLHAANGQLWYQILLFFIHGFFALWILFWYKTKIATLIVWWLTVSLQNRNMLIQSGADDLLRMLLFWSLFLPLDRYFSWDKNRYGMLPKTSLSGILSLGPVAFILQQLALYWVTAYFKLWPAWFGNGNAVYQILALETFHLPLSDITFQFTSVMRFATHASMFVEFFWPLLLVLPFWNTGARMVGILLIVGLHMGIMTHISVGIFPWISIVSILAFLPRDFWDVWVAKLAPKWTVTIYYDDMCGLCGRWIRVLQNFANLSGVTYTGLSRAPEEVKKLSAEHDMWVVERWEIYFLGYEGFVEVMAQSWIFRWFGIIWKWKISVFFGERVYHMLSKRRKYCTLPKPVLPYSESRWEKYIMSTILLISLYCTLAVNIGVMFCGNSWKTFFTAWPVSFVRLVWERWIHIFEWKHAGWIGKNFSAPKKPEACKKSTTWMNWYREFMSWWTMLPRLDQYWGMFAPKPAEEDYWFVIDAHLTSKKDGTSMGRDLWKAYAFPEEKGNIVSFEKYTNPHDIVISDRWRKYIYGFMAHKKNPNYTKNFAEYWCRKYNTDAENPYILEKFTLYGMSERVLENYKRWETKKEALWQQCCLKNGCFTEKTAQ